MHGPMAATSLRPPRSSTPEPTTPATTPRHPAWIAATLPLPSSAHGDARALAHDGVRLLPFRAVGPDGAGAVHLFDLDDGGSAQGAEERVVRGVAGRKGVREARLVEELGAQDHLRPWMMPRADS